VFVAMEALSTYPNRDVMREQCECLLHRFGFADHCLSYVTLSCYHAAFLWSVAYLFRYREISLQSKACSQHLHERDRLRAMARAAVLARPGGASRGHSLRAALGRGDSTLSVAKSLLPGIRALGIEELQESGSAEKSGTPLRKQVWCSIRH
jgi:hypothetical protein